MVRQHQTEIKLRAGHKSVDRRTDRRTDRVIPIYPPELRSLWVLNSFHNACIKVHKGFGYKIKIVCPSPTNATFQLLCQDWPISFENKHNNTQCTSQQKFVN